MSILSYWASTIKLITWIIVCVAAIIFTAYNCYKMKKEKGSYFRSSYKQNAIIGIIGLIAIACYGLWWL